MAWLLALGITNLTFLGILLVTWVQTCSRNVTMLLIVMLPPLTKGSKLTHRKPFEGTTDGVNVDTWLY